MIAEYRVVFAKTLIELEGHVVKVKEEGWLEERRILGRQVGGLFDLFYSDLVNEDPHDPHRFVSVLSRRVE